MLIAGQISQIGEERVAPLSIRSFISSKALRQRPVRPRLFHAGRPATKLSSITHWRNGSQATPAGSRTPVNCSILSSVSAVTAGNAVNHRRREGHLLRNPVGGSPSIARARAQTTLRVTWPFSGILSQDITLNAGKPAALRRARASTITPGADFGWCGFRISAAISGCSNCISPVDGEWQ